MPRDVSNALRSQGVSLLSDNPYSTPTHWLCFEYDIKSFRRMASVPLQHRFLICVEARIVDPRSFSRHILRKFSQVGTISSDIKMTSSSTKFPGGSFDSLHRPDDLFTNDGKRDGCVILNQNKFSLVSTSNYALRSRFVRHAHSLDIPLSVGGANWSRGYGWTTLHLLFHALIALRAHELPSLSQITLPQSRRSRNKLLGPISDGLDFLRRFQICVVIENESESSLVSEKLFNAFKAGCQCVYVGPRLNPDDFPKHFLHQAQASVSDICRAIKEARACSYSINSREIREWCQNSEFARKNSWNLRFSAILEQVLAWVRSSHDDFSH